MSDVPTIVLFVVCGSVVIGSWVLMPKYDHERIRENVEAHGGRVIEILRVWSISSRDRAYEVSYMTAQGERIKATCRTSMWNGVYWINDRPPGVDE
jgi:hypothetical protein